MNVKELYQVVNKLCPFEDAFEDDKVGVLVGSEKAEVKNLLVSHDISKEVLDKCVEENFDTLITYHPSVYRELDNLSFDENYGLPLEFLKLGINIISIHTAQDVASGGNADSLAEIFEINNTDIFAKTNDTKGAGRYGVINKIGQMEMKSLIENKLNTKIIRTNKHFEATDDFSSIALVPGSGTQFLNEVINKVDLFITGDYSHHHFLMADYYELAAVQVNHISTEIPGMQKFVDKLGIEIGRKLEYFFDNFYE